jgi:biopolymer transport protein ExbB
MQFAPTSFAQRTDDSENVSGRVRGKVLASPHKREKGLSDMTRNAYGKFRRILLVFLLGAVLLRTGAGHAQSPTTASSSSTPDNATRAPVGLFQVIMSNTDPIFFLIVICSIAGVTLIIQGFIQNRRSVLIPMPTVNQIRELIQQRQFKELIDFTESDPTFVSRALNPALKRAGQGFNAMKEAMETAIGEQTAEQFRKIEYLNILGNLGPLLGLLGTVLGMIAAFSEMNQKGGHATPADLAGGISKALAHTFLGLLLAIPCLAAFGVLRTIVDRLTVQGALIAEELLLMIRPAEAKPAAAASVVRSAAAPQPVPSPASGARKPIPAPPPTPAV